MIEIQLLAPASTSPTSTSHTSTLSSSAPLLSSPLFSAALQVRTAVFVDELGVPLENEVDDDDVRSWHWVAFSSASAGEAERVPIGTIRLVPPPHTDAAPRAGGVYVNGRLTNAEALDKEKNGQGREEKEEEQDPYIKLGRLAVLRTHRGQGVASALVHGVLDWARAHTGEVGGGWGTTQQRVKRQTWEQHAQQRSGNESGWQEGPLVHIHARAELEDVWRRQWGFTTDLSSGTWLEEGLPHVAMWRRLGIQGLRPSEAEA